MCDTVDHEWMKEELRMEFDIWVDEPEFIEMFQAVVELGAGKFSFIKDLIEFGELFVNSKVRRLRLSCFTQLNKFPSECPLVKIAALKRTYRRVPVYVNCPSIKNSWLKVDKQNYWSWKGFCAIFTSI